MTCLTSAYRTSVRVRLVRRAQRLRQLPSRGNRYLRSLGDRRPGEWAQAVAFDAAIRHGGAGATLLKGTAYLHPSRVPLPDAPIDRVSRRERATARATCSTSEPDHDPLEDGDLDGCSPFGSRSGIAA